MAFLKALARVGLVELDPEEQAAVDAASTKSAPKGSTPELSDEEFAAIMGEDMPPDDAPKPAARPAPAPAARAAAPAPRAQASLLEPVDFDGVYASSAVPPVPYAAEQLLKVLDGLRVMDANTRKTAIMAMDAADDAWTIADPVLDAQRKMKALDGARTMLATKMGQAEQSTDAEMKNLDAYQEEAVATIRAKIAEFEATLAKELQSVADQKAKLRADLDAQRAAVARESTRVGEEIERLAELERTFGAELRNPAGGA